MIRRSTTVCLAVLLALPLTGVISYLIPGSDVVQAANRISISVGPKASRYPRGTQLTITAQVRGGDRAPVVGTPILVQEISYNSPARRTVERRLASATTNHEGKFVLNYQVPTDVNKDKVTLVFVNPIAGGDSASFVIPIGQ